MAPRLAPRTGAASQSAASAAPDEVAIMVKYASGHALFLTASRLATVAKVRQAFRQQAAAGWRRKKGRFRMVGDYAMQDNETMGYLLEKASQAGSESDGVLVINFEL